MFCSAMMALNMGSGTDQRGGALPLHFSIFNEKLSNLRVKVCFCQLIVSHCPLNSSLLLTSLAEIRNTVHMGSGYCVNELLFTTNKMIIDALP